ncbi:probable glutamate receptor [Anabrus simplex]|uniref:probable glutamate receptor n=1 Tax=Anabrus simplex TaxID=316456 RepID=UPI0035A2A86A
MDITHHLCDPAIAPKVDLQWQEQRKDVFIRMRYDSQDSWKIYVAPFSISLWLTVAVCVLVITCCLAIMYYLLSTEKTSSLHDTFFSVLGAFCSQGVGSFPLHMSLRLAVWVTLLTGLLVVASYGARVTSSLAVKTPVLPFNDLEGLLKDKSYGFGMDGRTESVKIFRQSPGVRGMLYKQKILPNLNNLPMGNEEGFQRVCKEKYAYFCGRISVTPDNTPCELKRLPEASSYKYTVFILRKRSPYRRIINYTLRRMMLGGIYRKLYLQWLVFPDNSEPPPLESVDMSDVSALLLLFLAGGLTSLCVFLVELAIKMRQCFKVPICRQQI